MRLGWAIVCWAWSLGVGVAWWLSRDTPAQTEAKQRARRTRRGRADPRMRGPSLYRWRDDAGALQSPTTAPKGRNYERIDREPDAGIEVHGDRSD